MRINCTAEEKVVVFTREKEEETVFTRESITKEEEEEFNHKRTCELVSPTRFRAAPSQDCFVWP